MIGQHCIRTWSNTQKSITLSSGEAELVAAVKTCTEVIGLSQLAHDWGIELQCQVLVDSSAAICVVHRRGNGRLRHIRVGLLWIQEKAEEEEIKVDKVAGEMNPADLMTKNLMQTKMDAHMSRLRQEYRSGRAHASLQLNT